MKRWGGQLRHQSSLVFATVLLGSLASGAWRRGCGRCEMWSGRSQRLEWGGGQSSDWTGHLRLDRGKPGHSIFVPARPGLGHDLHLDLRDSRCFVRSSASKSAGFARGLPRKRRRGKDRVALLPRWAFLGVRAVIAAQLSRAHLIPKRASLVVWSTLGTCLEHGCSGGRVPRTSK